MRNARRSARATPAASARRDLVTLLEPRLDEGSTDERLLWLCARVAPSDGALAEIARLGAEMDESDWGRLAAQAREHGVENLLFTHVTRAGLLTRIPAELVARMRRGYGEVAIATRRLELTLARVLPLLHDAGAPAMVVKGLALSRRLYGNIALRPISDIDLIVHADDGVTAGAALGKAGFIPVAGKSAPLSRHALRFREMQYQDAKGQVIEIHVNPCRYPAYQRAFAPDAIWKAAVPLATAENVGMALALAPYDELRYLCMHYAVQHRIGRLIWLTDVAEIARRIPDARAWDALVEDCVARGAVAPVAVTLARARTLLDAPIPEATLDRLRHAALAPAARAAWDSAMREMSGLRWYLIQLGVVRTPLERATLLWNGARALAGRLRRRARQASRDTSEKP
jgi:hypothetical protein